MRCSHAGLIKIAEKGGVPFRKLKPGDALLFINTSKNRIKTLSWNGVLSYVNFHGTRRALDLSTIEEIPRAITPTGHMDYKKALRITLEKKLGEKRFKELEVL